MVMTETKSKLQEALFPYQKEDVEFMLNVPKVIDGNPMGLGKTLEALAVVERVNAKHVLITCKKPFIKEWFNFIDNWADGDCLTPNEQGNRLDGLNLKDPHFVVVNHDLLSSREYWSMIQEVKWDVIIHDEAHKFKNHEAKRTRYMYLLNAPRVLFLTGTPMQNSPADLFPYFHVINPGNYSNHKQWIRYFCVRTEQEVWLKGPDGVPRPRLIRNIVPGKSANTEQLNYLLHKYMCRWEKSEILKDLPPKMYRVVPIELGPERKQYNTMKEELFAMLDSGEQITAPKVIAQLIRLRQICLDPNLLSSEPIKSSTPSNKTTTLLELLEDTTEKVLVFSFFEQYIRILSAELTKNNIKHVTITGKRKESENAAACFMFQNDPSVRVALGTTGSMGESWTLTEAKIVIFSDLFWNPAVNNQCEDRTYGRVNMGLDQKESVLIIDLYCQGTVEDHVHEVVRNKQEIFNEVVVRRNVIDMMRREP